MTGPISKALEQWASRSQQFTSTVAGWSAFLHWIVDGQGTQLDPVDRWSVRKIVDAVLVELDDEDLEGAGVGGEIATLEARTDVRMAFRKFASERGLPLPESWPGA